MFLRIVFAFIMQRAIVHFTERDDALGYLEVPSFLLIFTNNLWIQHNAI